VDYLGAQGYWVCTLVAALSFVLMVAMGQPIAGTIVMFFYYLGGVGVRERSRYRPQSSSVSILDTLISQVCSGCDCGSAIFNLRATWMAARWSQTRRKLSCHRAWAKPSPTS
jgi:hypothetical protein